MFEVGLAGREMSSGGGSTHRDKGEECPDGVMRNLKIVPENCSAAKHSTKPPTTGKFSSSRSLAVPTGGPNEIDLAADARG